MSQFYTTSFCSNVGGSSPDSFAFLLFILMFRMLNCPLFQFVRINLFSEKITVRLKMACVFSKLVNFDTLIAFHTGTSELAAFVVKEMVLVGLLVEHLPAAVGTRLPDVLALEPQVVNVVVVPHHLGVLLFGPLVHAEGDALVLPIQQLRVLARNLFLFV